MVRRTAGIESTTFWSGVKSATRCKCFRIKKSGNVLAPDPCWKWIICPEIFLRPPSGFNGRPLSALYIGALILERSFAEFGISILLFTANDNGHWWMEKYLAEVSAKKKSAIEICINKIAVDNITTIATCHCLNDIWIHRPQKYFKKFPSVFSTVFAPRLSYPPPPLLPQSSGLYWSDTDFHRS